MTPPSDARPGETTPIPEYPGDCLGCGCRYIDHGEPGLACPEFTGGFSRVHKYRDTPAPLSPPAARGAEATDDDWYDEDKAMCACGHSFRDHAGKSFHYACARVGCPCQTFRAARPEPTPDAALREAAQRVVTEWEAPPREERSLSPAIVALRTALRAALAQEGGR